MRNKIDEHFLKVPIIKPVIPEIPKIDFKDYRLADTLYEHIKYHIEEMYKSLSSDEELDIIFTAKGGQDIKVSDIGYHNPNMIMIYGTEDEGDSCCILAHMNTIQLILKIFRTDSNSKQKRKIGFINQC